MHAGPEDEESGPVVPSALLMRPTHGELLRDTALDWIGIALALGCCLVTPAWTYPLWAALIGGRLHALGALLHDAIHIPPGETSVALSLTKALCSLPIGISPEAMRLHHLRHHRDNGFRSDPTWWSVQSRFPHALTILIRCVLGSPVCFIRGVVGALALWVPPLRRVYGEQLLLLKFGADDFSSPRFLRAYRNEIPQVFIHLLLIPLIIAAPGAFVFYYLIPMGLAFGFATVRVLAEHDWTLRVDRRTLDLTLRNTRDHSLGLVGALFLAPHNIGYHVVHHLHPQVSHSYLPALRAWYLAHQPDWYPREERSFGEVLSSRTTVAATDTAAA